MVFTIWLEDAYSQTYTERINSVCIEGESRDVTQDCDSDGLAATNYCLVGNSNVEGFS